ncbi:MAG: hypothetical protein HYY30_03245 [Chloroflexi bacterium]|nr:hypothetical protein [Chloroflexota bacterium]
MNEKAFTEVKRRELRRFHGAVDSVVEGLLLKKYEETRKADEYRDYARVCGLIKSNLHTLDLIADKTGPLFETTDERSNWEIYLSGLRHILRKTSDSYLFKFVLPMLGLDGVREKLSAYTVKCLDQLHASQKTMREVDGYVRNLSKGCAIGQEYRAQDNELPRLYASIKTWSSKDDLDHFLTGLAEFLDVSVEVFVVGPVQLYLMLGRDAFMMIFKALSVGKLSELRESDRHYEDTMRLHEFVNGLMANSTTVQVMQEVMKESVKEYTKRLRDEQERLRAQLPTKELKQRFAQRYESGILFRTREE